MKKRLLTCLLALAMLLGLLIGGVQAADYRFLDVSADDWYYDAVHFVAVKGLMSGTGRGFEPERPISRAMLWTVLARLDGQKAKRSTAPDWYAAAQLWAVRKDVSDGSDPNGTLTREQLATMLYRYAARNGLVRTGLYADLSAYADASAVSSYAQEAVKWAAETGIITGMDGKLNPQGSATRAQVAQILYRLCEIWNLPAQDSAAALLGVILPGMMQQHTHDWQKPAANANGTHTFTCDCGETRTEYCDFPSKNGTVTCPTCGFTTDHGVKDYAALADALQAGGEIYITDDILAEETLTISKDTTVYGDGHILTIDDEHFNGKMLFDNEENRGADLTLDHIVIDGEGKERTKCLVLIKNSQADLLIQNSEIKNFNGTQIIASREQPGSVTVKNTTIHDNALKTFTTCLTHDTHHNYYKEELATLIWVQKHNAVFENVSITKNTIDTGDMDYKCKNCLGNGVLIFFRGDGTNGYAFDASNLIIEENEAPRHIFATYATLSNHTYTFASGHIGGNRVESPENVIFVVGNLTIGEDMLVEANIVLNNDGTKGICTLTNNGTIIGNILSAEWAVSSRGCPIYTGTGTYSGTLTGFKEQN